jgi:hypothetical protein
MEIGTKIYIYGLIDDKGNIFYVGKSSQPKNRFYSHVRQLNRYDIKMQVLDFFYDKEVYWIEKLLKEGHDVQNKEIISTLEQCEIGEVFEISQRTPNKVMYNGKIYNSLNDLYKSRATNLSEYFLKKIVTDPNCDLAKQYPIILIYNK